MSNLLINIYSTKNTILHNFNSKLPAPKHYKEVDFDRITEAAETVLSQYSKVIANKSSLSLRDRIDAYGKLSEALEVLEAHVNRTKTLWEKFLSLFTPLSKGERRLQNIAKRVNNAFDAAKTKENNLWAGEHWFLRLFHFLTDGAGGQLKTQFNRARKSLEGRIRAAAFRVLGEHKVNGKVANGEHPWIAIKNIQQDISLFMDKMNPFLTLEQIAELNSIYGNLKTAKSHLMELMQIRYFKQLSKKFPEPSQNHQERLKDIATKVRKEIASLKRGQNMILPGGYSHEKGGHAVIYNISKEDDGTFTFTIVNTGAGLGHFSGLLSNLYSMFTEKYHDYEIQKLSFGDIANEQFLISLFEVYVGDDGSVNKMYQPILKYLAKNDVSKFAKGRYHWIQKNGTCAHDSVICWMESMMDPQLFQALLLFMTKKGLENLNTFSAKADLSSPSGSPIATQLPSPLLDTIRSYGQDTFKQRRNNFLLFKDNEKMKEKEIALQNKAWLTKKNKQFHFDKLKKWEKRESPFYLEHLTIEVESLKKAYCAVANIKDSKDCKSPYSFFSFSQPPKAVADAWKDYSEKADLFQKMQLKFSDKSYRSKIKNKIKYHDLQFTNLSLENTRAAHALKEFQSRQKGYAAIYKALG